MIWASCPCEQYSIARSSALKPRDLMLADSLALRVQAILHWFRPTCWFVENPTTSLLWRRFTWPRLVRASYCAYGFPYRENTTIATNMQDFFLRDPCGGAGVCAQMLGTRHREHAQKGGGGSTALFIRGTSYIGSPRACAVTWSCGVRRRGQTRCGCKPSWCKGGSMPRCDYRD